MTIESGTLEEESKSMCIIHALYFTNFHSYEKLLLLSTIICPCYTACGQSCSYLGWTSATIGDYCYCFVCLQNSVLVAVCAKCCRPVLIQSDMKDGIEQVLERRELPRSGMPSVWLFPAKGEWPRTHLILWRCCFDDFSGNNKGINVGLQIMLQPCTLLSLVARTWETFCWYSWLLSYIQDCQLSVRKLNPRQYIADISEVSWPLHMTSDIHDSWMDSSLYHWTCQYQGLTVFCALDYSSCTLMKCISNIHACKFWLQLKNVEVWFQRASDVVRKLKSGDVDMGIVGYDMLREYGEVRILPDFVKIHEQTVHWLLPIYSENSHLLLS